MELKPDMYVRFKKGKVIYVRKLLEVIHHFETFNVYRTDKEYFDYEEKDYFDVVYPDDIISEPSYDIVDLIEVGDYVNGDKIIEKINNTLYIESANYIGDKTFILDSDIKSIVTKEEFESMEYEL